MDPSVWIALGINAAGVVAMLGSRYQQVRDHERRITEVENTKVEKEVYSLDIRRLDKDIEFVRGQGVEGLRAANHRISNAEQRIVGVAPRNAS